MPIDFRLGSFIALMLFVFFQLTILYTYLIINKVTTNFPLVLSIIFWAYFSIILVANIRTFRNVEDAIENYNSTNESENLIKNFKFKYILLGFIWRLGREWHYIKRTANLDFK